MAASRTGSSDRRRGRRWFFAGCSLDEDSWCLLVDGQRAALEAKPMELLHELLLQAGKVVTKDELLDRICQTSLWWRHRCRPRSASCGWR